MPMSVIDEIISNDYIYPRSPSFTKHTNVCVMFCDIVGFSTYCKTHTCQEVGQLLHTVFSIFDTNLQKYSLEKIRTIGDGYLVTSGVFAGYYNSSVKITNKPYLFAKQVAYECNKLHVQLRIGIHVGNIISGIVGQKSNQFDLFGHDDNITARLEQTCELGCVHVSKTYYNYIKDYLSNDDVVKNVVINMKNIGDIDTVMIKYDEDLRLSNSWNTV
jgi:class 3 adenylate cyclase